MKTPEDEAFEDIERRQGGFPAKRAMAADKLHWSDCAVHNGPAYPAGPCDCGVAQKPEREALKLIGALHEHMAISSEERILLEKAITQPTQEPIAYVTGTHNGRFVVAPLNSAMVLPVGMAFYTTPPKRPWIGLTDEDGCAMPQAWWDGALWAEAKLKEKNT